MVECSYNLGRNRHYISVQSRDMRRDFVPAIHRDNRSSAQMAGSDDLLVCSIGVCGGHMIQVGLVVVQKLYEHEFELLQSSKLEI